MAPVQRAGINRVGRNPAVRCLRDVNVLWYPSWAMRGCLCRTAQFYSTSRAASERSTLAIGRVVPIHGLPSEIRHVHRARAGVVRARKTPGGGKGERHSSIAWRAVLLQTAVSTRRQMTGQAARLLHTSHECYSAPELHTVQSMGAASVTCQCSCGSATILLHRGIASTQKKERLRIFSQHHQLQVSRGAAIVC